MRLVDVNAVWPNHFMKMFFSCDNFDPFTQGSFADLAFCEVRARVNGIKNAMRQWVFIFAAKEAREDIL